MVYLNHAIPNILCQSNIVTNYGVFRAHRGAIIIDLKLSKAIKVLGICGGSNKNTAKCHKPSVSYKNKTKS